MTVGDPALPRGYVTVRARHGSGIFHETCARELEGVLERQTLHDWARTVPGVTTYEGRLPAYGVPLTGTPYRIVVRHATHGGVLAPFTRDRFFRHGRALHEIRVSHALRVRGVSTPRVIGFARYPAALVLSRLDVVSDEVPDACDLVAALAQGDIERQPLLEATARLLGTLARAGAHHADLNQKNVLLSGDVRSPIAFVLDVDRVALGVVPAEAMRRNLARLARSARKWRTKGGPNLSEDDLRWLASRSGDPAS